LHQEGLIVVLLVVDEPDLMGLLEFRRRVGAALPEVLALYPYIFYDFAPQQPFFVHHLTQQ